MSVERADPRRCHPHAAITPLRAPLQPPPSFFGGGRAHARAAAAETRGRVLLPGNGGGALLHRRPSGTGGAPGRWQRPGAGLVAPQATGRAVGARCLAAGVAGRGAWLGAGGSVWAWAGPGRARSEWLLSSSEKRQRGGERGKMSPVRARGSRSTQR